MAFVATAYTITNFNLVPWGRNPKSWEFQGSNDITFATYDVLDAQTGYTFAAMSVEFSFANTTSYQAYRLYITEAHSAGWAPAIDQLAIALTPGGADQTATMLADDDPAPVVITANYDWPSYPAWGAFDKSSGFWMDNPGGTWYGPCWLQYDTGAAPGPPPGPPGPNPWVVPVRDDRMAPRSGRMELSDRDVVNIADWLDGVDTGVIRTLLKGGTPATGRFVAEDSSIVNIADILGG